MGLANISFENILSGLLLKFGRTSNTDIKIIVDMLVEFNLINYVPSNYARDYRNIAKYVLNMSEYFYVVSDEAASRELDVRQGQIMKEFLANLDLEEFVIRKLSYLNAIPDYAIPSVFSNQQEKVLDKLVDEYTAIYVWNDDVPHDDFKEIQLTSLGKARIFMIEYREQVQEFAELLKNNGYNYNLMVDFLRKQNLDDDVYNILNIDNFLLFCSMYDRDATLSGDEVIKLSK